ncbi:hypothetical protein IFM89_017226 [Coptis chinensis]|uniref:Cytochrome P450 n=1 Tax=Coptis chinensis TaxID=261450 RepID=A0A835LIY9_9MAGN|nr:hypothetical protein IFM89_017226 [Coptis chinensis]
MTPKLHFFFTLHPLPSNLISLAMELNIFFLLLIYILLLIISRFLLTRYRNHLVKSVNLPPSPIALPLLGHLYLLGPLLHQSFQNLSNKFGPLIHLQLGSLGPVVVASSPSMAREFLKTQELNFASRPRLLGSEYTGEGSSGFTFTPYGPYWKFMKKLCITELFSTKKLNYFSTIRHEEIRFFLISLLEKSKLDEPIDMEVALTALTNNIICRMAMSTRCSGSTNEAEECREIVKELIVVAGKLNLVHILGIFGSFDLFGYGKRLGEVHRRYMVMVERIMKDHEEKRKDHHRGAWECNEEDDLMDILMKISEDDKAEMQLSRDDIKAFLQWPVANTFLKLYQDIFAAGTETSSVALQWALAELINNPHVFKKAREEIESVVGTDKLVQESDIPNLPYIQAIVKETLRLHPTAPVILRECNKDCNIEGYDILNKTKIFINIWAIGRDPKYWENPLEFKPERFLNQEAFVDGKGVQFQLLPFGSGRRSCPGEPLALHVMHVTVASMVQCFDWRISGSIGKQAGVDMKERPGFTLRMASPLQCIPRSHCAPFYISS